ncbi:MAG: molecular chaperone DnaK [Candidatus Altiarchaeales archaeon ex4484_43]|nr:MAG: molecular chaperone DnaK [Candidatus Altiarchaeales archaeon ex4484_43]
MAEEKVKREKIIGIDLGTSNSQAAVMLGGKPTIIPSAEGATYAGKMFPSCVAFTKDGQMLVGEPARRQAVSNPEGTIMGVKRKMGTNYKYKIYGKEYTPQEISSYILRKIKTDAESFLGEPVKKAVITVPAYFDDNQRTATKDAGTIAGLDVVRIINEPTAASLAYGIDRSEKEHNIMVFDFGAGTLDVTIMEFGEGVFEVLSTSGDTQLGGRDMDEAIVNYLTDEFKKDTGIDLRKDKTAMERIREAAERAKIELSTVLETEINLPYITADQTGPKHLTKKIKRAKLEKLVAPIVEKCRKPMEQAIKDAKVKPEDISKIILVGGPTRMPIVRKFVEDFVGKKAERGVDPMECVAMGAAIQGGVLAGEVKDIVLLDVTPLTLGIETLGGVVTPLIERNTTIPVKKSQVFTTAADFQTAVTVHVVQGERPMAADNTSLGQFNLVGIPPAPRGVPQIEVTFDIDANGILNVSAKDLGTGKEQKITITASTKLPKEKIEEMMKEAEKYAEEDKRRKEEVEVRNNADSLIYATEKTLSEFGDKLGKEQKEEIDKAKKALNEALKGKDIEEIKKKMDELSKAVQKVGATIYQQAQAAQAQGAEEKKEQKEEKEKKEEGEVVDAEYKVEEEEKK